MQLVERQAMSYADDMLVDDIQDTQRRVGNLSPRGGCPRDCVRGEVSPLETVHMDTVAITDSLAQEKVICKERTDARSRGLRAGFPSDRTLQSMVSSSRNTFSVLSDD